MKISLEWLNEFVDITDLTEEQIVHELTMSGLEVEETRRLCDGACLYLAVAHGEPVIAVILTDDRCCKSHAVTVCADEMA